VSWGWFTPGELGSRVDLCQDPDPPPFWNTGASVSQSPSRQWAWQSLATPIFWAIFSGGFFGLYIKFVYFFESCWWLWFSLGSLWQQIDKRRGRAHPQVLVGVATKWAATPFGHSGNNWQAEAWRRFRIITASFWYQLMFTSGKQPHVTLLIDGALKSRKVPVRLNSYQCNYLLFGLRSFFCVCFFDWFFWSISIVWPRRTRWKTNLIFLDFRRFFSFVKSWRKY
jgi:hypothetical protein